MMRYLLTGLCVLIVGITIDLYASETEIKLKDDTSSSVFSVKDGSSNSILHVQGDGNVGIGTTAPNSAVILQVMGTGPSDWKGGASFGDANAAVIMGQLTDVATIGGHNGALNAWTDLAINAAGGNVGIGTSVPTEKLDVAGNIKASGTITPSDFRFKKNILTLNGALDKVQNLRGVSYNWRTTQFTERGFADKRSIGIIAQEVEKVVPEVVHTGSDGYKGVEYSKLVPLLIEAIKEQQEEISSLSQKIKVLEDRI